MQSSTHAGSCSFFFDKVQVKGSLDVFIKPGKRNGEAKIYADAEIIDLVHLHVSERTLFIDANNTLTIRRRLLPQIVRRKKVSRRSRHIH